MFILVVFGYRQSRLFTIDCLTATLMDSIWQSAHKELQSNFIKREELFNKEKITLQKKIAKTEARLEQIEKEEDKPIEGVNVLAKKAVFTSIHYIALGTNPFPNWTGSKESRASS